MFVYDLGKEESLARECFVLNAGKHIHMQKMLFCLLFIFLNFIDSKKYSHVFVDIYSVVTMQIHHTNVKSEDYKLGIAATSHVYVGNLKVFSVCILKRKRHNSVEMLP